MLKTIMKATIALLAAGASMLAAPLAQAQQTHKITWVYATPSAYYWDAFAAIELGLFKKEGLEVEAVRAENVGQQMQMLVTNAVEVVSANTELVISAVDKGANLAIVAGETARVGFTLMARPEIKSYQDLRGKTLGVTQLEEATATMLQLLLKKNGVAPNEYELIPLGGTPNRYAALTRGAVSATMLSPPSDFKAEANGMRTLGYAYEAFEGPQVTFVVQRGWAAKNSEALVKFLRALLAADAWLQDPKNKSAAVDILVKHIKSDKSDAEQSYETFYAAKTPIMTKGLSVTPEGIKAFLDLRNSDKDPNSYLDLKYLQQAKGR